MVAKLDSKRVNGKASCQPIQEELNDNPYYRNDLNDIKDDNALFYCEKVKEMINHSYQQK